MDQIAAQKSFMTRVYGWMLGGLLTTALMAMYVLSSGLYEVILSSRILFFGAILAELGLVMWLSAGINRMSVPTAIMAFLAYSALNGLTLSALLAAYGLDAIFSTFVACASMFGAASVYGMITKRDLTSIGGFFIMGVVGLIVMSVVNIFLHASALEFGISIIGVIIFVGLTAYDAQKLKDLSVQMSESGELASKGAIIGALTLYLDFINLFLFLLRLLGRRN